MCRVNNFANLVCKACKRTNAVKPTVYFYFFARQEQAPKTYQKRPKRSQGGLKRPQDDLRRSPDDPKMSKRCPKTSKDASKPHPSHPKTPRRRPKMPPRRLKTPPRRPKTCPRRPKTPPAHIENVPDIHFLTIHCLWGGVEFPLSPDAACTNTLRLPRLCLVVEMYEDVRVDAAT